MFTGLIQKKGVLERMQRSGAGARICIGHEPWSSTLELGESVAVQGVCLTVAKCTRGTFECDVLSETLSRTNLKNAAKGTSLNLERALLPSDRLGGHFVTGHVDGVAVVAKVGKQVSDLVLELECDQALLDGIVMKGSVACDGVSLTVSRLSTKGFKVSLIPFTWDNTSLGRLKAGSAVNIETDMIGKYVQSFLKKSSQGSGLTVEKLRNAGFSA